MTQEERTKMVEDNMKLVYWVIHKFYPAFGQDEDLIQAGMVGLIHAVNNYDPEKGNFGSFAITCIRYKVMQEFKDRIKWGNPMSIDAPLLGTEDFSPLDTIASNEKVDVSVMSICDKVLTEEEKKIFEFVANGGILADLARDTGKSKQAVSQVYRRACNKLKIALREET